MSLLAIVAAVFGSMFANFYTAQKTVRSIKLTDQIECQTDQIKPQKKQIECQAIVFDLGGVVVDTSKQKTTREIGLGTLVSYWWNSKEKDSFGKLRTRFYELVAAADKPDNPWNIKDEHGKLVPQLMADWLHGERSNQDILDTITHWAKNNTEWFTHSSERKALLKVARLTFHPETFIKTRKLFPETEKLIRECKQRGFKLYVLSNWDKESGKLLVKQHADLFSLFDGVVFSGDVQATKPDKAIFEHIPKELPAESCIFLDDQADNIQAAQELGFNTIHVQQDKRMMGSEPDIASVREQLSQVIPTHPMHAHA